MPEITDPGIIEALEKLATQDPVAAQLSAPAIAWLTGGGGAGRITQERVQRFCWYDLPLKWQVDFVGRQAVASAVGRTLDLLELPRYGEICHSEVTRKVHAAYDVSIESGHAAFRQANLASGIYPVDLDEFKWGAAMGMEESRALAGVQDFLELAVATGDLVPGTRGWKNKQAKFVRSYLDAPSFQLGGQTPIDVVRTERIQLWINAEQSEIRRILLSELANRLLHPAELPEGVDPYQSISAVLTLAARSAPDFEYSASMFTIAGMAKAMGLVRRRSGTFVITRKGLDALANPGALLPIVAGSFLQGNPFHRMAGELLMALLVDSDGVPYRQIVGTVTGAVREAGYREAGSGLAPGETSITRAIRETLEPLRLLLLVEEDGRPDGNIALSPVGKATALEALRLRATGPGSLPWP